jgi:hypothetical protein
VIMSDDLMAGKSADTQAFSDTERSHDTQCIYRIMSTGVLRRP